MVVAVLLRVLAHISVRTRCMSGWGARQQRCKQRWNARLNQWARNGAPPPAQRVVRADSDGKLESGTAQASPRLDDAQLVVELRRLQRLVESRSAAGEAAC